MQKATSSVLDFFEHLRSRTRFSFLHESCSSSSQLSKEFWMTSFRYPSEELWPKYERCAELKNMNENYSIYFILFYFIFQCGAHKQKELKKMEKEISLRTLTFQRKKGKTKKREKTKKAKSKKDGKFCLWGWKNIYAEGFFDWGGDAEKNSAHTHTHGKRRKKFVKK